MNLATKKPRVYTAQGGWRFVGGKNHYFRSKWEYYFATYLQWQLENKIILNWEYEPKTFWFESIKRGVRSYKPDFRVIRAQGETIWYEVKGYMDKRSSTKIERFKRFYPDEHLIVVDKVWFQQRGIYKKER